MGFSLQTPTDNTSPAALTVCNAALPAKSKIVAWGPQNGLQGLPPDFWALPSTFTNKFVDPSTPSMRKVDNGEKKKKSKIISFIVATNVVASRPPECRPTGTPTACAKNVVTHQRGSKGLLLSS